MRLEDLNLNMKTTTLTARLTRQGFTFTEVMVAVGVVGVMVVSLYLGISTGFAMIQRTRENLRATQILTQRLETVRLYTWDQLRNVTTPARFQTKFTEIYNPLAATNGTGGGVVYYGTVAVTTPPVEILPASVTYRTNVALVTVTLLWTNKTGTVSLPHRRQFQTLVAKSGMQKYVYGSK